jgi:hypothetical protein
MRERKSGRIVEACGRAVNDLSYQGQRLQCAWAKFLKQKQFGKVMKISFVSQSQHRTQPFQIDVCGADLVTSGQAQIPAGVGLAIGDA